MNDENINILLNNMSRAVMMDMAILDIEEFIVRDSRDEITEYQIDQLPTILLEEEEETECGICLEHASPLHRLSCAHHFCKSCLVNWLGIKNACPMCRAPAIVNNETVSVAHIKRGMFLLRQLLYAMMCEDARASLFTHPEEDPEDIGTSTTSSEEEGI